MNLKRAKSQAVLECLIADQADCLIVEFCILECCFGITSKLVIFVIFHSGTKFVHSQIVLASELYEFFYSNTSWCVTDRYDTCIMYVIQFYVWSGHLMYSEITLF